ncbi:MAG: toprim domain-containing protein [Pricia sp.]
MKRKRIDRLTCERARAFPIERALAKLGYFPAISTEKEAWFLSPFRLEAQASFKVSKELNRWYDHGAGKGGKVIDLVCLVKGYSVKETLQFLNTGRTSFSFHQQHAFENGLHDRNTLTVIDVRPLAHAALQRYILSRGISMTVASKFCREVHYMFRQRRYFAIGLGNNSGGWELRNKYLKNCSSPKDITHIRNGNTKLIVTEGIFDLLSILELYENSECDYDFLVMNSTAFVRKAMEIIKKYTIIELYLDNDDNGKRTARMLIESSGNCRDRSSLFKGFKDINDYRMAGGMYENGQGIQDVSLLPQRRSCLAPDGRKEGKK